MKRLAFLFGGTLLVLASACTIRSKSAPLDLEEDDRPSGGTAPSDDSTIQGTEGEQLDIPSAAPDEGTTPASRPKPQAGGGVRTCDAPQTTAKPLRRSRIYTKTNAVELGAAIIDDKASTKTFWATGTMKAPTNASTENQSDAAPDLDKVATLLGWSDEPGYDLYSTHINGRNAVQIWADAMTPTSRRMTYTMATSSTQQPYKLSPEKRNAGAPTDTDDKYVRYLSASKAVGISLVITTASDCATGALADLLGRQPLLKAGGDAAGTLLDPSKRQDIQKLLVRDGAEIMIAAITSRADTKIDQLVKETTCSPTDLTACEKVLDSLVDAADTFMKTQGAPTYETLSAGTDPNWAFTTFTAGDVRTLAP